MKAGKYIKLIPVAGMLVFLALSVIAAAKYPCGNYLDNQFPCFSIFHNYWCDLLNPLAHNGEPNPSRPFSIAATVILCLSLVVFWMYVPSAFTISRVNKRTIQIAGTTGMLVGMLIFTPLHSEAITIAGFFGGIAFLATFIGLYKSKWNKLFWLGVVCLLLGIITFTVYKTRVAIIILPMIQKVTLALCMIWIALIDERMRKQTKVLDEKLKM